MRFFHYRATDASGRPAEGTIRAATAEAAHTALTQAGYRVSSVSEPPANTAVAPPSSARPQVPIVRPEAFRTIPAAPGISVPSVPATAPGTVKTPFGKDRDLFFLFSQLAQYYKAGVTPQSGLDELSKKSRSRYQASLQEAAGAVAEGKPISSVLERYPYLYPPDVVAVTRAGESAGHLGEAFGQISEHMRLSHRLKRRLSYFLFVLVALLGLFPMVYATVTGSLKSIAAQDKAGGSLPVYGTLGSSVASDIVHILPVALPLALAFIGFLMFWHSMPMRGLRHRLVSTFPVLAGRAKAEAMARFTWAMSMISRGGVSPQTTFRLAAETVPNLAIRERLVAAASTMHESERLSTALRRSGSLPVEYAHIVETGEVTGDVPRALDNIRKANEVDFQARDATAVVSVSVIFFAILGLITLVMTVFLYRLYATGIISTLTQDESLIGFWIVKVPF